MGAAAARRRIDATRGESAAPVLRRSLLDVSMKAAPAGDTGRFVDVIASSATEDGAGEILMQNWDLSRYLKAPIVLWNHNADGWSDASGADALPIGYATNVRVEGGDAGLLKARLNFVDEKANPIAEQVYQGLVQGSIRGVSVGYLAGKNTNARIETRDGRDVYVVSGLELVEISAVPVGCNPEAVVDTQAKALAWVKSLHRSDSPKEKGRTMQAIAKALGVNEDASEDVLASHAKVHVEASAKVLAIAGAKSVDDALGTIAGWKRAAEQGAKDAAELATLRASQRTGAVKALLDDAERVGKVYPSDRNEIAIAAGASVVEGVADLSSVEPTRLSALIKVLPAKGKAQTSPRSSDEPAPTDAAGAASLTPREKKLAKAGGVTEEAYAASKARRAARLAADEGIDQ